MKETPFTSLLLNLCTLWWLWIFPSGGRIRMRPTSGDNIKIKDNGHRKYVEDSHVCMKE